MAITSSAKKAIRASKKKALYNVRRKRAILREKINVRKLVAAGKTEDATKALALAYKAIDKAVKANYIKKNTGSRMKSRLAALINKGVK